MKGITPETPSGWPQDSSYGRLLRRVDQAMDVARTREWMAGRPLLVAELELSGLSVEDQQLLWRIIDALPVSTPSSATPVAPALQETPQQNH
ncbi:MAG: hypothetical protein R6V43_03295 [Halopseudomonas sp.]